MRLAHWILGVSIVLVLLSLPSVRGDELETFLESQERLLGDESVAAGERAGVALGMVAVLDRAAGRAGTVEERRGRWERAVGILDRFSRAHPNVSESRELQAQAAVFEWAIGASWLHQAMLTPLDAVPRERAVEALDAAAGRMQMLLSGSEDKASPLARQIRVRLARALRDRAELEPEGSRTAKERLNQALEVLGDTDELGDLAGPGRIEKARVLLGLDRADEAQAEVDRVVKNSADVPESEWIDVRVRTLLARGQFAEAETLLGTRPESAEIHRLRLELALHRWEAARKENDEEARKSAEGSAFAEVRALQERGGDLAIEGLLRLSDGLSEPSEELLAEDLDLLARGRLRAGRLEEASRLDVRASEAAKARGEDEESARYRLRGGDTAEGEASSAGATSSGSGGERGFREGIAVESGVAGGAGDEGWGDVASVGGEGVRRGAEAGDRAVSGVDGGGGGPLVAGAGESGSRGHDGGDGIVGEDSGGACAVAGCTTGESGVED